MENLTKRQNELIISLLRVYHSRAFHWVKEKQKEFIWNNRTYNILIEDYEDVCEIIDYIKGVKHDE